MPEDPLQRLRDELNALRGEMEELKAQGKIPPIPTPPAPPGRPSQLPLLGLPTFPKRPPLFGAKGRMGPMPVTDTKTGVTYDSKYQAGLTFAGEFPGTDPRYLWYKLIARYPGRFREL